MPRVLALTADSYRKEQFYADTATFIRMTTPEVALSQLSSKSAVKPWASDVKDQIDRFFLCEKGDLETAERSLKLLGCVFKGALRNTRAELAEHIDTLIVRDDAAAVAGLLTVFEDDLRTALRRLRKVGEKCRVDRVPGDLLQAWLAVDEYTSLIAEEALTEVVRQVQPLAARPALAEPLEAVRELAVAQFKHRVKRGFETFATDESRNEDLPHRWRVLKRFVSSALWIDVSREQPGAVIGDAIGMVAAAVAMLIATVSMVVIQQRWAVGMSAAFVGAMVVAYVIKDRTKEWGKRYLGRRLRRYISDHALLLRSPTTGQQLGVCRESFQLTGVRKVPEPIRALRFSDLDSHDAIEGRPETVMQYTKRIKLSSRTLQREFAGATGITDVLRLNLQSLCKRMDDPWEVYRYIHPATGELCETPCARVYHINVVLRICSPGEPDSTTRVRVVMGQDGIHRVESVVGPGAETDALVHDDDETEGEARLTDERLEE